jgi:hypothetical protein
MSVLINVLEKDSITCQFSLQKKDIGVAGVKI